MRRDQPDGANRFRSRYIDAGGHFWHEVSVGQGNGLVFLLVHGIGVSHRYFLPLMKDLATKGRVVAVDLPGFGASSRPGRALSMEEYSVALEAYIRAADLGGSVLVGQSMGCQIVARLVAREPELARSAVLIGPTVDPAGGSLVQQGARLFTDAFREPWRLDALILRDYLKAGARRYLATARLMVRDRIEEVLPRCEGRVLVARGEHDPIVPREWGEQAAALLPQGSLREVRGGAHNCHWTHPDEIASLCLEAAGA